MTLTRRRLARLWSRCFPLGVLLLTPVQAIGEAATEPSSPVFVRELLWTSGDHVSDRRDSTCTSCHQPAADFSHPTGVVPAMPVPTDMPLVRGRVGCVTCHAIGNRSGAQSHGGLRGGITGSAFCAQCHDPVSGRRVDLHAMMLGQAHLEWRNGPVSASRPARPGIESDSAKCLVCHDGSVARDIGHEDPVGLIGTAGSLGVSASHPVDVAYRVSNPAHADGPLVSIAALDDRVRLFDGRVTCGSCHSPYSPERNHIVMSNLGSRLCLSCHEY